MMGEWGTWKGDNWVANPPEKTFSDDMDQYKYDQYGNLGSVNQNNDWIPVISEKAFDLAIKNKVFRRINNQNKYI